MKLHLGSGPILLPGWVNIDIEPSHKPDLVLDYLELHESFKENTVDMIFSCHSLEHVSYPSGVIRFFEQALHVLKPGGTLRLVVPDLMKVARKYVNGESLQDIYNFNAFSYKECPAERFTYFARGWSHTVLFDERLLTILMQESGFANIRIMPFGKSDIPELRGLDRMETESISIECKKTMNRPLIRHAGCIGDLLASLPIARHLGGAHYVVCQYKNPSWANKRMGGARYEAIRPLLERQSYVASVRFEADPKHCDYDLEMWRHEHRTDRTLTASQAAALGIHGKIDMNPWIEGVEPSPEAEGRIIVCRTARYHNNIFPWQHLVNLHAERMLFLGLPDEHEAFCAAFGARVEYRSTGNMVEVAELIAGSELVIANQSCHGWIAMGLGHRFIQETSHVVQDSIVRYPGAQFCLNGRIGEPEGLPFGLMVKSLTSVSQKLMNETTSQKSMNETAPYFGAMKWEHINDKWVKVPK